MTLPRQVEIVEVSPRDGLQMLPAFVPTESKVKLIQSLRETGFRRVESVAFVSSKHVPQMADASEVLQGIGKSETAQTMALALNKTGYQRAVEAGVEWICYVIAATETMSKRNANTTIHDGIETTKQAIKAAHEKKIKVRASIAVCWVCPFEGEVPKERVLEITKELVEAGADEIAFNDTVGRAVPNDVFELCGQAKRRFPDTQFAGHFHDTNFTALANIYAAMTADWSVFDSAVAGLGGCPFAPGASGNVATEKVFWMLNKMGVEIGLNEERLKEAVSFAKTITKSSEFQL